MKKYILRKLSLLVMSLLSFSVFAGNINKVDFGKNENGKFEIQIVGSSLKGIKSFSLNNPARIVVDIPKAKSSLGNNNIKIGRGVINDIVIIQGDNKTRVTVNLKEVVSFSANETDAGVAIVLNVTGKKSLSVTRKTAQVGKSIIKKVTFKSGKEQQGIVRLSLNKDTSVVDVKTEGSKVILSTNAGIPKNIRKRLKVTDFGTPVKSIDVLSNKIVIETIGEDFEYISYQNEKLFSLEFSKKAKDEDSSKLIAFDSNKKYAGETLSLNFQDIGVRSVIQLIADFTNTNMVISDEVKGSITLRLNNTPWDQALDIILKSKGLSKRESSGVIFISTTEAIAKGERQELGALTQKIDLAPTVVEIIPIQYARAEALEKIIVKEGCRSAVNKSNSNQNCGFLSARGSLTVDERTNSLVIQDVRSRINEVRAVINKLDKPVKQVLIDARIVSASDDFTYDMGVKWGGGIRGHKYSASNDLGTTGIVGTGNQPGVSGGGFGNRIGVVDAASKNTIGGIAFGFLADNFLLNLELSAAETDGRIEIVSSPRILTQDGAEAKISQGSEVAYATTSDKGTKTEFKQVELVLEVKPKITPNNMVDMELVITKDTLQPGDATGSAPIDTSEVKSKVLVENGETVVLGGVYEQTKEHTQRKVPFFGSLPIIGKAFRSDSVRNEKSELLIFVTPKIVDNRFTTNDKFSNLRN